MKQKKDINFRPQMIFMSEQNWKEALEWSKEINQKKEVQWGRRKRIVKKRGSPVIGTVKTVRNSGVNI